MDGILGLKMKLPKDIFTKRFQYWWPWNVSRWWWFYIDHGCDEWGHSSIMIGIPFLGMFVFFYGRMDRSTWYLLGHSKDMGSFFSPDGDRVAHVPLESIPVKELNEWSNGHGFINWSEERVLEHAHAIEEVGD